MAIVVVPGIGERAATTVCDGGGPRHEGGRFTLHGHLGAQSQRRATGSAELSAPTVDQVHRQSRVGKYLGVAGLARRLAAATGNHPGCRSRYEVGDGYRLSLCCHSAKCARIAAIYSLSTPYASNSRSGMRARNPRDSANIARSKPGLCSARSASSCRRW
jgi:hypothetical protein